MTAPATGRAPTAFFLTLPGTGGQRFALYHAPAAGAARAAIVFVHALADEMNKSRRMVAMASRRLAAEGLAVLQIDLQGCGDSPAEFGVANWVQWRKDVEHALSWMSAQHAGAPLVLWGHRAGCLLAAEVAAGLQSTRVSLLLWQPPASGRTIVQQLVRLAAAAEMQAGTSADEASAAGGAAQAMRELRAEWAAGRSVHIAGYEVCAALAEGLERATLQAPARPLRVAWLEASTREPCELLPASRLACERWAAAGHHVHSAAVAGPAFWQTQEIEDAPALIDATVQALAHLMAEDDATDTAQTAVADKAVDGPGAAQLPEQSQTADIGANVHESALAFACEGESLLGVLSQPRHITGAAVLVIVGGPQYRAGSHRQFVQLARALARAGHPVLRFDVRGMGDSGGDLVDFQRSGADIAAARSALAAALPTGTPIVLWGLCDGASAALLHLDRLDAPPAGLALANPWVRSEQTLAVTHVKHYYGQRLMQREFWAKLLRGGVGIGAMREFAAKLKTTRQARSNSRSSARGFQQRMAEGFASHDGPVLMLISETDITAREFLEFKEVDPAWQAAWKRRPPRMVTLPSADHTFSDPESQLAAEQATIQWLAHFARAPARASATTPT